MQSMSQQIIIVGGGIGGLATALACARVDCGVQVLEQSPVLAEVGAGIQLGPNVTRVLQGWGLQDELQRVSACPERLEVRHALRGTLLATLPLGRLMAQRYGAPYLTVARADLQALLHSAVQRIGVMPLMLDTRATGFVDDAEHIQVHTERGQTLQADALVGADGLWSQVRNRIWGDGVPRVTGHLAYRAMLPQAQLPAALRSQVITAWLGPHFHVVQYPVRGGKWLNVVAIVHGNPPGDLRNWDHRANAAELRVLLANVGSPLLDLIHAIPDWRLWTLCDRPPMQSAAEHAKGRVALVGDAAHPMRPYLAQGAGMAIEDAQTLALALRLAQADDGPTVPEALQRFANARWQRNARVQARALRNGEIFHFTGPLRMGRDVSLKFLGARVLDVPWLYDHRVDV
jgi:salicylate hydroxylase